MITGPCSGADEEATVARSPRVGKTVASERIREGKARPGGFEPPTGGLEVRCSILAELRARRRESRSIVPVIAVLFGLVKSLD